MEFYIYLAFGLGICFIIVFTQTILLNKELREELRGYQKERVFINVFDALNYKPNTVNQIRKNQQSLNDYRVRIKRSDGEVEAFILDWIDRKIKENTNALIKATEQIEKVKNYKH
ncbi:hypothetical protein F132_21 [Flavobacterium sp. phage 1/32]|nr:hypothetical protein F132_21 [Flavobacterium sp. phage 1/32]